MTIWVGQDGSYNDDDGDGAASPDEEASPYDDADRNPALMNFLDIPSTINEEIPIETEHTVVVHDQPIVYEEASAPPFELAPELPLLDVEPFGGGGEVLIMPGPAPMMPQMMIEQETLPWWHPHHHHHHPHFTPEPHLPRPHHFRAPKPTVAQRLQKIAQQGQGGCPPGMMKDRNGKCVVPHVTQHATHGEFTGWQDPFTDWDGNLFEGMGQYGVYDVTDPWEPATHEAIPYPPAREAPTSEAAAPPSPAQTQQPESPRSTPQAPASPGVPHYGPPAPGSKKQRQRPSVSSPGHASVRGPIATGLDLRAPFTDAYGNITKTATGFDVPFTDDDGNLLMDPHPSHRDWPYPMTYGDPVMTGWSAPLTDLEGQLLAGPGQYGQFTMEDPYDHRSFNNVELDNEDLIGDPFYYYTGTDEEYLTGADADAGQQLGSAFGSMLGSATGDTSGSWGQAGGQIASSIEQGSDTGDWGSAAASIATSVAKVAIPAIVKAATSSSSKSTAPTIPGGAPTSTTTPTTTTTPAPNRAATTKLFKQLHVLASRYGIPLPKRHAAHPAAQTTAQQLQQFMQSVAPQG